MLYPDYSAITFPERGNRLFDKSEKVVGTQLTRVCQSISRSEMNRVIRNTPFESLIESRCNYTLDLLANSNRQEHSWEIDFPKRYYKNSSNTLY